ncbi:hypothetical protein QEH52_19470 [Coraliomargarita sp. SDUM461003]|uniref:Transposase n=1 Tax=Thalassobacterium maritimum TaxID=3041265 RepID=A0ABU1B2P2_9BACT|nr:hypothetical protein [Coraliomargarita sp. SDUM461003]MDQ8209707.1 hypothetical protein [Coraliomargarita sp. SDUM461003]
MRRLSEGQVLDYLIYLRDDQKLAASTVNQVLVPVIEAEPVPVCCPQCEPPMQRLRKILSARGPPLSSALLYVQS